MASFFSHPAFPAAILISKIAPHFSRRLLILCVLLTLLPDADVIAFKFGIPSESQWGHRGFTHSIIFALFMGALCIPFTKKLHSTPKTVFFSAFLSTLSHSIFDALTNGGLGVAFFWPFHHERYFFPVRPVLVSPIGIKGFISMRGVLVVLNEIIWIWGPCLILSYLIRKKRARQG